MVLSTNQANLIGPTGETEEVSSESGAASSSSTFDKPLVVIEPSKAIVPLKLADLWSHRELLYFLTWRDVKIRYKQTVMGAAWAVIQPICMMVVFTILFGRIAGAHMRDDIPYPLFALAGLVPWTFFANSVTTSGSSLVNSASLITKVYFPRLLLPLASVAACTVDLILSLTVLGVMMAYYGVRPGPSIVILPLLLVMTLAFAVAVGTWLSALNVKYRDVRFILPFVIQLWLFVSCVIVPSSTIPQRWRWLLKLNPMAGIIEGYRSALFGHPINWFDLLIAGVTTLVMLIVAAYSFRRAERLFADII